jgi:hypothetical protein
MNRSSFSSESESQSCRAMVIYKELEFFAGNEMQTYSTINCTLEIYRKNEVGHFYELLYHSIIILKLFFP